MASDDTHYKGFRNASARRAGYDYSQAGAYFITICTAGRERFFGNISAFDAASASAFLLPTPLAVAAWQCWHQIPTYYAFARADEFVVMPDHIHGIITIERPAATETRAAPVFGPQHDNLAAVLRGFKVGVTQWAARAGLAFGWQSRFHDRIIRSDEERAKIAWYIDQNPARWADEHAQPDGVFR